MRVCRDGNRTREMFERRSFMVCGVGWGGGPQRVGGGEC